MPIELRDTYLFSTLTDEQLQEVQDISRKVQLNEGEVLFECGDTATRFFLVISGQIKLSRLSLEGNEKVIGIVQPGNTFAEALMFLEHPAYPVAASAIKESTLLAFDTQRFQQMLRGSVETCFRMMGDMSQRLRSLIKEIDDLTLQSATNRVANLLLDHHLMAGNHTFSLESPKGILASRLSVKPETFSRILHNLSDLGVIKVKGNQISILDLEKLYETAHAESLIGLKARDISGGYCPLHERKRRIGSSPV
jgi:CRP-like cAMP-binding protein